MKSLKRLCFIISFGFLLTCYSSFNFIRSSSLLPKENCNCSCNYVLDRAENENQFKQPCPISVYAYIGIEKNQPNLAEMFPVPRLDSVHLPRRTTKNEYDTLIRLLNLSLSVFQENGIDYTIGGGGLVGAYVMHDLLPWDEELDIMIHNSSKDKLIELFKDDRHYGIQGHNKQSGQGKIVKLYFNSSESVGKYPWKWPFIDVETYIEDGEQLKLADRSDRNISWPRDSHFPTHRRPFGPLWINVPRDPKMYLRAHYLHPFACHSHNWDHKEARGQKVLRADCELLKTHYPFVERSPYANITKETLVLNGTAYYSVYIDEPFTKSQFKYGWW